MKACFQIAECSLTSAKLMQTSAMAKKSSHFIYCALLYPSSLYLSSNHLYIFLHAIFISIFRPCPKSFLRLRSILIKSPQPPLPPLSYIKNEAAIGLKSPPRCLILYISNPRNHPLYISSEIKNHPLYISSEIKIILYPRARNRHHSIYFLGTKVSQVWSS
mgnify:CR=1 FL=1